MEERGLKMPRNQLEFLTLLRVVSFEINTITVVRNIQGEGIRVAKE